MKKYKILKDWYTDHGKELNNLKNKILIRCHNKTLYSVEEHSAITIWKEVVENNPDVFEEITEPEVLQVRIKKAELPTYWYADKIGYIYNVKHVDAGEWNAFELERKRNGFTISKSDCEII